MTLHLKYLPMGNYLFVVQWSYISYNLGMNVPNEQIFIDRGTSFDTTYGFFYLSDKILLLPHYPFLRVHRSMKSLFLYKQVPNYYLVFRYTADGHPNGMLLGNLKLLKVDLKSTDNWIHNYNFYVPYVCIKKTIFLQKVDFWISRSMNIRLLNPRDYDENKCCKMSIYPHNHIVQGFVTMIGLFRIQVCWKPKNFNKYINQTTIVIVNSKYLIRFHATTERVKMLKYLKYDGSLIHLDKYCSEDKETFLEEGIVYLGNYSPIEGYTINVIEIRTYQSNSKSAILIASVEAISYMGLKTLRGVIKGDDHGNNDPDKEATNLLEGKLVKKELTREANVEIGSDTYEPSTSTGIREGTKRRAEEEDYKYYETTSGLKKKSKKHHLEHKQTKEDEYKYND